VSYDNNNNERNNEIFFTQRLKAGKRRTYFFDVRSTKGNDYFITLTESKKKFDDNGYERHKIYIYKEDFNKFHKALGEAINHVKTELLPVLMPSVTLKISEIGTIFFDKTNLFKFL
jgi:hypothetical protein